MNQIVVIFVPYGETFAGIGASEPRRSKPQDERVNVCGTATLKSPEEAEQLPLWRWFTFEKNS